MKALSRTKSHYRVEAKLQSGSKRWREMLEKDQERYLSELEQESLDTEDE